LVGLSATHKTVAFNGSAVELGIWEASQGTSSSPDVACGAFVPQAESSQLLCEGHYLTAFLEFAFANSKKVLNTPGAILYGDVK